MSELKHRLLVWLWSHCNVYIDHEGDWYDDWVKIKKPKLVLADEYCGETRVVYKIGPGD